MGIRIRRKAEVSWQGTVDDGSGLSGSAAGRLPARTLSDHALARNATPTPRSWSGLHMPLASRCL